MGKGDSSNFKMGWDRVVSVPGPFKLDHLQLIEPILFQKIFNFFTFILGGQFLLPQRANNGKRGFTQLWNWKNALSHYWSSGVIRKGPQYKGEKVGKFWEQDGLKWLQMVQFEWPRHSKLPLLSNSWVGWFPISHNWPSGVIRIGLPVWRWKNWKPYERKWAQWATNGPVWMPQALKTLCLIQFWSWKNSLFPLLALWGNKKWLPSMKV